MKKREYEYNHRGVGMSSRDFNVEESYDDIMTKGLKSLKKIELHN